MFNGRIEKQERYNRIKGILYGVACGDCLGAPVEFMSARDICSQYGRVRDIVGGGWLGSLAGRGTDDTAMTLAVAEGLMKTGPLDNPIEKIGREFTRWYYDAPIGAGAACSHAIGLASNNGKVKTPTANNWFQAAEQTHYNLGGRSGGNGSLMRTAPVALFCRGKAMPQLAVDVSKMTHFDDDAAEACALYCGILAKFLMGHTADIALSDLKKSKDYGTLPTDPNPSGYVKDSFKTALFGWLHETTFEEALITVVNMGGDADTTGAIAGGLAGAEFGYYAIPERWINALDKKLKNRLDACTRAAAKVWNCEQD